MVLTEVMNEFPRAVGEAFLDTHTAHVIDLLLQDVGVGLYTRVLGSILFLSARRLVIPLSKSVLRLGLQNWLNGVWVANRKITRENICRLVVIVPMVHCPQLVGQIAATHIFTR